MKNVLQTSVLLLFLCFNYSILSQDLTPKKISKYTTSVKKALDNGKYKYCTSSCDVIVEIKGDSYTEYYPNEEFIKANIKWVTKDEYKLIITAIEKKGLPFNVGTIMTTKIIRTKGNTHYYESHLDGLTWSGKFIKTLEK